MRGKSIRYYFFTSITTVLVASVLVMGLLQTYIATSYFRAERQKSMREVAEVLAGAAQAGHLETKGDLLSLQYMAQISGADVYVVNEAGVVQYSVGATAPLSGTKLAKPVMDTLRQNG